MLERYRHLLKEKEGTNFLFWNKERELLTLCKILAGKQLEIKYKWTLK